MRGLSLPKLFLSNRVALGTLDGRLRPSDSSSMTTTVEIAADGKLTLPEVLRKSKRLRAGSRLRVTEADENILLTPVYAPSEEELVAVIETAGGPGSKETPKNRKQVEAAMERVRAREREAKGRS